MLLALLLSATGPIVTGVAAFSGNSSTQLAHFIRRAAELVALFTSRWVFRYVHRNGELPAERKGQLERGAGLTVAGTMACSAAVMLTVAVCRFGNYQPTGNVTSDLVIAGLGLIVNSLFWRRYTSLTKEKHNLVIAAQRTLYRAKALADLCVVFALGAVAIGPQHPAVRYIDIIGAVAVGTYLLYSGLRSART